ncbi:MAG: metallophosphoesterase family protein [Eubacteriales bacterium]
MRILHTSDWHLGIPDRTGEVMEDQKFFLEQLYNIINGEKIDAVIVAGDVYDSAGVGADAVGVWNEAATKICLGLHAKMLVISKPRLRGEARGLPGAAVGVGAVHFGAA